MVFSKAIKPQRLLALLLGFALLLHIPFASNATFFADDYIQHFALHGNAQLEDKGFANTGEPGKLGYAIENQFLFFQPNAQNHTALIKSGAIPWWVHEHATVHFFRPLASFSHWLDYQLWPESVTMMHAHNTLIVLLGFAAAFMLYQRFLTGSTLLLLAMLILVLDVSAVFPLSWVAARNSLLLMLWLPLVLLSLHQAQQQKRWLLSAGFFYICAVFSAEGGVAIGGFVLAWLLFVQQGSWGSRGWMFLPFVLITVLWRVYYQSQGYGAQGVGQYIDPATEPLAWLWHLFQHYPVLVLHMVTGLEATDFYLRGQWRIAHALFGYLLMLLPMWLALKLNVADRIWWFFYGGALLSLLPMASLTLSDPRVSVLAHIGFAPALAIILSTFFRQAKSSTVGGQGFAVLLLGFLHLLLPLVIYMAFTVVQPQAGADAEDARFNAFEGLDIENRHLLIVNAVDPFRLMYHAYRNAWHNEPVAASIRPLMLAHDETHIRRLGNKRYRIEQAIGMLLHPGDVARWHKTKKQHWWQNPGSVGGVEGMSYLLLGFFHNGDYDFVEGQRLDFAEASIIIEKLTDGRPSVLLVKLHKSDSLWLYWDWQSRSYRQLPPLAIGESKVIRGKYDDS